MSTEVELNEDDEALAYTLGARLKLAKSVFALDVTQCDAKDISNALKALDGVDKQIINKRRLVLEDKNGNENAKAAKMIADVLKQIGSSRPYEVQGGTDREPPTLPDDIPRPEVLPGETSQIPLQSSVEEFMRRNG